MESLTDEEMYRILGTSAAADANGLRAAYLAKIREHPPERDPEEFERIRDAYQTLSDPIRKTRRFFDSNALRTPLGDLAKAGEKVAGRPFLGLAAWREALQQAARAAGNNARSRQ